MFSVPEHTLDSSDLESDSVSDSVAHSDSSFITAFQPTRVELDNTMAESDGMVVDTPTGAQRHILPVLAKFSGDRTKYSAWRAKVVVKIRVDGDKMGGEYGQIAAVFNALEGSAESNCSPFFERLLEKDGATLLEAREYLDRLYEDGDAQREALSQWNMLRQGRDKFEDFFAEFERLLARAGGMEFPEQVKMMTLTRATARELTLPSVGSEDAENLQALANRYRRTARALAQLNGPTVQYATAGAGTISAPVAYGDPMEVDVPGTFHAQVRGRGGRGRGSRGGGRGGVQAAPARVNASGTNGPGLPSDAQLRGRTAKWVSKEELDRRKAAHACFRCGRLGCSVAQCPLAAARNPNAHTSVAAVEVAYVEPRLEDVVAGAGAEPAEN